MSIAFIVWAFACLGVAMYCLKRAFEGYNTICWTFLWLFNSTMAGAGFYLATT